MTGSCAFTCGTCWKLATYARSFNSSRGSPPLPAAPTRGLSDEERAVHEWAIDERDRFAAHVDRDSHRRVHYGHAPGPDDEFTLQWFESWTPPSPAQLETLARLADKLGAAYGAEANRLEAEAEPVWEEPPAGFE
jgi:hypothetical protein